MSFSPSSHPLTAMSLAFAAGASAAIAVVHVVWCSRAKARDAGTPAVLTTKASCLLARADKLVPDAEKREGFVEVFDDLCKEFVQDLDEYGLYSVSSKPLRRMIEYNVPGGKLNRGLSVVQSALMVDAFLNGSPSVSKKSALIRRSAVLGWCIEWMQASFLVADDLMDSSVTRRGQPCWYKQPAVGLISVNDSLVLMTQIDMLLHKYFGSNPALFIQLHRIMTETAYQTELGQFLDLTTQPPQGPIDLDCFTEERHRLIVQYKTAYYSFYAPLALSMVLAGVRDTDSLALCKEICVKMGIYFQVQDDYLDCYGSPEQIGKIGTDIQDSKCGWLVVQALKRASQSQKKTIRENYGKDDADCIAKIKAVYADLSLESVYHAYEENVYQELVALINEKVTTVPKEIYFGLLNKIYKRQK